MKLNELFVFKNESNTSLLSLLLGTSFFSIIIAKTGISLYSLEWFKNYPSVPELVASPFILLLGLIFYNYSIKFINLMSNYFTLIIDAAKGNNFIFDSNKTNIILQGRFIPKGNTEFSITNSHSGFLIKDKKFKNFELSFDFKFDDVQKYPLLNNHNQIAGIHSNKLGIIFRANNLENYFMLQIGFHKNVNNDEYESPKSSFAFIVTPHIRVDGRWEVFGGNHLKKTKVKIKKFNSIKLIVKNNICTLDTGQDTWDWYLPTNFIMGDTTKEEKKIDENKRSEISFNNNFGMIGFRAHGAEFAIVKTVKIKHLYKL